MNGKEGKTASNAAAAAAEEEEEEEEGRERKILLLLKGEDERGRRIDIHLRCSRGKRSTAGSAAPTSCSSPWRRRNRERSSRSLPLCLSSASVV
jgi:hypothetical protein